MLKSLVKVLNDIKDFMLYAEIEECETEFEKKSA